MELVDDADGLWSLDELPPPNLDDDYFYSLLADVEDRAEQKQPETTKILLPPRYFIPMSDSGLESLSGDSRRPESTG